MQLSEVVRERRGEETTARKTEGGGREEFLNPIECWGAERSRAAGQASNAVTGRVFPCEARCQEAPHTHTHTLSFVSKGGTLLLYKAAFKLQGISCSAQRLCV